jgi:ATP-dependent helicase YprA (DUF1998 family)
MRLTPSEAFEHIKESVIQYLETAYKIAHPAIYAERGDILRQKGVIAQLPFIEATPAFPSAHKLAEMEQLYPEMVAPGLTALMKHGVPVDRFPLYTHQEEALLASVGKKPNLLVATGTGSGKTESFMLPILNDLLHEAPTWAPVSGAERAGGYDQLHGWQHSRRHERRPAAMRGLILYPMNALVNDQLSRLRRILARGNSPAWQKEQWGGNVIHFGMYTGLTLPTGHWSNQSKRSSFRDYLNRLTADWERLREDLRDTGNWPRPNSPEMLCRWDMQLAPPDVLVTNYSMLEYMMVRYIESGIFKRTRQWLKDYPEGRFTLVLDEAHTYKGALGTEVAYLIRRLKEHLGLAPGSSQFRAIATTASVPEGADEQLTGFVADLFGEPKDRFTLARVGDAAHVLPERHQTASALLAFQKFHQGFSLTTPEPAIQQLAQDLGAVAPDPTLPPQVALYQLLEHNNDIHWTRQRTARKATLLDALANETWGNLGTDIEQAQATAGILAAGSYARASALPDTPPLISVRMHAFFRGVNGLWACMDPSCPHAQSLPAGITSRPVGKLYMDPRPWCACGARVLEVYTCRHCGLLYLGGIPDPLDSLWPWTNDFSGERRNENQFRIFGVEAPDAYARVSYRSTRTTLPTHEHDSYARPVYEINNDLDEVEVTRPFPNQCPRCHNYSSASFQENGREVIENLKTKGPKTFSVIAEDGFRVQPRATDSKAPNYGRKELLFTDSRQDAALLAADLRNDHFTDTFRQLLYRALMACPVCEGEKYVEVQDHYIIGQEPKFMRQPCSACQGNGLSFNPQSLSYEQLQTRVLALQLKRGIDPTQGVFHEISNGQDFFKELANNNQRCYDWSQRAFQAFLRKELAQSREFALEPLGLARWQITFAQTPDGTFDLLTTEETMQMIQNVTRLLATENILLPPQPLPPWEWSEKFIQEYDRRVLYRGQGTFNDANLRRKFTPYNMETRRKLGRYIHAIAYALVMQGRLQPEREEQWIENLSSPLWNTLCGLKILEPAGQKYNNRITPFGIRIDAFTLYPGLPQVHLCNACRYIMSDALFNVCLRCGQETSVIPATEIISYYRRACLQALPSSIFDDPYPIRAVEHTAQIRSKEARDEERWFQDLFQDDQMPEDYRVDILSVTTTMEMGIDIGSLLSVGMRNIPPTVANYQQRAGRAGRRGSALATVLSFAQFRSHDQYYFDHPPEIVSHPPRVPALQLTNEVIVQRHVRSLILQQFMQTIRAQQNSQAQPTTRLFEAWGTVAEYTNKLWSTRLRSYIGAQKATLLAKCQNVVAPIFYPKLEKWIAVLPQEVQAVVNQHESNEGLLEILINASLLPKYAFPIDVVSLHIPTNQFADEDDEPYTRDDGMQRDLKIALAEYAPGAEIVRGSFPETYIYKSVGVYDRYNAIPDYHPTGVMVECQDCKSVTILQPQDEAPDMCEECGSITTSSLPYLRPPGFTVDAALSNAGRERYKRGGRERSGYALPARLMVGGTAFAQGKPQLAFAPDLYVHARRGKLFTYNKGPNTDFPGFLICPDCGRALDPDNVGLHTYPNNVPPFTGRSRGPRAGTQCPNTNPISNQVILGHDFYSEVILFGVHLPDELDAPYATPAGQAVWLSFGNLMTNAAARVLQIDQSELQVGIRAMRRESGRLQGEVYIYDNVPGGAGYARAIEQNLKEITEKALELAEQCSNPDCHGACYHCILDRQNQNYHAQLDRALGAAVLRYLLHGELPTPDLQKVEQGAIALTEYAYENWEALPGREIYGQTFARILRNREGEEVGLWVIHPLQARPNKDDQLFFLNAIGLRCAVHTTFDLEYRPFWSVNNLVGGRV